MSRPWIFCIWLLAASVAVAGPSGFARYQVIIDRAPFGALATNGVSGAAAPSFTQRYQFVGLVYSNGVPQAIINDTQNKRAYFCSAGEMLQDVKVVKVDVDPPKLVLQHGLEMGELKFAEQKNAAPAPPMPFRPMMMPNAVPQPSAFGPRRIPFRRETQ